MNGSKTSLKKIKCFIRKSSIFIAAEDSCNGEPEQQK